MLAFRTAYAQSDYFDFAVETLRQASPKLFITTRNIRNPVKLSRVTAEVTVEAIIWQTLTTG